MAQIVKISPFLGLWETNEKKLKLKWYKLFFPNLQIFTTSPWECMKKIHKLWLHGLKDYSIQS